MIPVIIRNSSILFLALTFIYCSGTNSSDSSVKSKFEEICDTPIPIIYKNTLDVNNRGGHLQGVQLLNHNNTTYALLSGSSSTYSYFAIVKLDGINKVVSVNKLMDKPFKHAGGFQVFQNFMAIGIEDNSKKDRSKVCIYNISNPENPPLEPICLIEREGGILRSTAGCVGITKYKDNALIAVGDWDTKHIDFYSCPFDKLNSIENNFEKMFTIDTETVSKDNWVNDSWLPYQNINLFTDKRNNLFLFGFGQNGKGENVVDLFSLDLNNYNKHTLTKIATKVFNCTEGVYFRAGAGVKVTDNGEFSIISCGSHIRGTSTLNYFHKSVKQ